MKDKPSKDSSPQERPLASTFLKRQATPLLPSRVFSEEVTKMPKKPKSKIPGVVPGLEPRELVAVPVAGPSVRRNRKCPICRVRAGVVDAQIGPVIVRVCDECAAPVMTGLQFLSALKRFFP